MFQTFTCPSSGVLIYRLFHCRMWCYALGVVAAVLRSWCVVLCTVCPKHVEAIYENKIIVTLFASNWYIFLTYNIYLYNTINFIQIVKYIQWQEQIFICTHTMHIKTDFTNSQEILNYIPYSKKISNTEWNTKNRPAVSQTMVVGLGLCIGN